MGTQTLKPVGYHYGRMKWRYRSHVDTSKPCKDDHCAVCGGKLYHAKDIYSHVICEDCGLTYLVILMTVGENMIKV